MEGNALKTGKLHMTDHGMDLDGLPYVRPFNRGCVCILQTMGFVSVYGEW